MKVNFDFSTLAKTRWYEYGIRILFGGAITGVAMIFLFHRNDTAGFLWAFQ
jgi:hypothetical protein